jgi:ADP-ribose pyrophosphatase YjhB (NUDIX family)
MTRFATSASVVIFDKNDRVLLSHRRDLDIWNLPGGDVEIGELPQDALIRNTRKNTGLKIKIKDLIGVYGKPRKDEFTFVYLGKVKGGNLEKTKEADRHRYFKLKRIPKNTLPKHLERIQYAARKSKTPISRRQKSTAARKLRKQLRNQS